MNVLSLPATASALSFLENIMAAMGPNVSPLCTSAMRVFNSVSWIGWPWGALMRAGVNILSPSHVIV